VLSDLGQNDLAVKHFQSRKYPSWGYEVEQGATTIWERWNSYTREHGFNGPDGRQNAGMNSFSHYAFGAVCEWMFTHLAGIDAGSPGYKSVVIRPCPPALDSNLEREPIDWVKAHYDSIHGRIAVEWRNAPRQFDLQVAIPPNTTATVFLPAGRDSRILEGGQPLAAVPSVKFHGMEHDRAVLKIGSGFYQFEVIEQ
jgi:alpha-L-rhamnosidase